MFITYGIWAIIYLYFKYKYSIELKNKNIKSFSLKVAGVTFTNDDGTDRQKAISKLFVGEELRLYPYKYKNQNAIYVKNTNDIILGNIPNDNITEIYNKITNDNIEKVSVKKVDTFVNEKNKTIYYLIINIFIKK